MKFQFTLFFLILLFVFACRTVSKKQLITATEQKTILFKQVNIFNGIDSVLLPNKDVLIKKGRILEISDFINDSGYFLVQGKGKTLMPGLIDAHVHLSGSGAVPWENYSANEEYNLTAYLYAGITTVYDLGGLASSISGLKKKVDQGNFLGPDIYHTHIPITVKNSHPIPLTKIMLPWPLKAMVNQISPTINQPEEAEGLIKNYLKSEVDYIKVSCDQIPPGSPEMSLQQMKALIKAAHEFNKKVIVHIGSPADAIKAIAAGADVLAHGPWRGELSPAQADSIGQSNIPIIYTLAGFQNISEIYNGTFSPTTLDKLLVDPAILEPVSGEKGKDVRDQEVMNAFFAEAQVQQGFWKNNFKLLQQRGVQFAVGTDSNLPGTYAGSTFFQEMELLKEYGSSNFQILHGATDFNAHLFLAEPDFGSIEVGKKANLLLISGNPLKDLSLLKTPDLIVKSGQIITRTIGQ